MQCLILDWILGQKNKEHFGDIWGKFDYKLYIHYCCLTNHSEMWWLERTIII